MIWIWWRTSTQATCRFRPTEVFRYASSYWFLWVYGQMMSPCALAGDLLKIQTCAAFRHYVTFPKLYFSSFIVCFIHYSPSII